MTSPIGGSANSSLQSPGLDPYVAAKLPGAKPPVPKKPDTLFHPTPLTPNTRLEHPECLSFSEKKRQFEKSSKSENSQTNDGGAISSESSSTLLKETTTTTTTESSRQRFSYLSANELERMREEERKKLSNFSEEQLKSSILEKEHEEYDEADDIVADLLDTNGGLSVLEEEEDFQEEAFTDDNETGRVQTKRIFRSKRAERLYFEKLGIDIESQEYANMTPAQRKAMEAEKRRDWRQARLKSIEDDVTLRSMMN